MQLLHVGYGRVEGENPIVCPHCGRLMTWAGRINLLLQPPYVRTTLLMGGVPKYICEHGCTCENTFGPPSELACAIFEGYMVPVDTSCV